MLEVGTPAPDFTLPDQGGNSVSLSDFKGKKVLLWFFPKAMTSGCTAEGCTIRDEYAQFQEKNIAVLGLSADSPERQKKFADKYEFQYQLLGDENKDVLRAYHAWGKKKMYGREFDGIIRISYLIDENGIIAKAYPKVKTKTHAQDVLADL